MGMAADPITADAAGCRSFEGPVGLPRGCQLDSSHSTSDLLLPDRLCVHSLLYIHPKRIESGELPTSTACRREFAHA